MTIDTEINPVDPRDERTYYINETPLRRIFVATVRLFFRLITQISASGMEHLPAEGPLVLAANHLSNFDAFPLQLSIPRPIFFMAKTELHQNRIMDAFLRQLGSFPVNRGARDEWAMNHARRILDHGQVLGIFPEGTRSEAGSLRNAKTGAARLALAAGCPILPLGITGTPRIFRDFPRRTAVTIRLGPPIFPQPYDTALSLTDQLMFTLADMLPVEMRGMYAQRPFGF